MAAPVLPNKGCRPHSKGAGALHKEPLILDELWAIIIRIIDKEKQTVGCHACSWAGGTSLI